MSLSPGSFYGTCCSDQQIQLLKFCRKFCQCRVLKTNQKHSCYWLSFTDDQKTEADVEFRLLMQSFGTNTTAEFVV